VPEADPPNFSAADDVQNHRMRDQQSDASRGGPRLPQGPVRRSNGRAGQQRRRVPAQRFVRQASDHRVPRGTLAPASATPLIGLDDTTRQHRTIRLQSLANNLQTQLVETSERSQIRASEGSVRHVEVSPVDSVRTPIIRRPRPLRHRPHADPRYTLNCEELHMIESPRNCLPAPIAWGSTPP